LAYLAARLPATYAAAAAALNRIPDEAFGSAVSVLDLGAGPGTATWAFRARRADLKRAHLIESDPGMLDHARALAAAFPDLSVEASEGDLLERLAGAEPADWVLMAYVLSEVAPEKRALLLEAAWDKAKEGVLLLEPGTPETSRCVLEARTLWAAKGGSLLGPCPQAGACPMETAPGQAVPGSVAWCHFSARLERRGLHRAVKAAGLGYEDEKFSWVAFSKRPGLKPAFPYRLHSDPHRGNRHITLDVCGPQGRREELFYNRRDTPYGVRRDARRLRWGDGWDPSDPAHAQEEGDED
jgi:ribosomal protein RSM22 (predicted rRNA methylase)